MIFWGSRETKQNLEELLALEKEIFAPVARFRENETVAARVESPFTLFATALSDNRKKLLGYFSLAVVCERFYQKLLAGEAKAEEFEPWDEKDTAVLFLREMLVKNQRATPYLFRLAIRELLKLCDDYDLYVHRCFTIAARPKTQKLLTLFGFERVGLYEREHPIMLASRDRSAVLNSFLKKYDAPQNSCGAPARG